MKVGIDIQATLGPQSGLGVFTKNLVSALESCKSEDLELVQCSSGSDSRMNTLQRMIWENIQLPMKISGKGLDVLHVPAFAPPLLKTTKLVVTVHDIIGVRFANQMGGASRFYWGTWLPNRVKQADIVIADSFHTKADLVQHLGMDPSDIKVVYPSGHEGFHPCENQEKIKDVLKKLDIPQAPYFLFVGTIEPRKNLKTALKAFLKLKNEHSDECNNLRFVVVGAKDFAHGQAFAKLREECKFDSDSVAFTGYVSDEDLNTLYSGSVCFVFPSLYEGFGMPVLEAMGAGTAVITSNTTSLPEVAGDAAVLVNPLSVNELMEAMFSLYKSTDMREDFIQKGYQNIKRFSWNQAANQVLEIYGNVLDQRVAKKKHKIVT